MINMFMLIEAINSTALSHEADCECDTCKAAQGDSEALSRVILKMQREQDHTKGKG